MWEMCRDVSISSCLKATFVPITLRYPKRVGFLRTQKVLTRVSVRDAKGMVLLLVMSERLLLLRLIAVLLLVNLVELPNDGQLRIVLRNGFLMR